jgi:metal-responsive CopG/Arc/MetJ family transcriptional regulator
VRDYPTVSLKKQLVAQIDAFLVANPWGYSNRAEVVTAAVRQFLEGPALSRAELERALRAVAALEPKTPTALAEALLAELDMKVRKPAHQATTDKSSSESTSRR